MAVKCPDCGAENAYDARSCQSCAGTLAPTELSDSLLAQPATENKPRTRVLLGALVIAVVLVFVALALRSFITWNPDLRADLVYGTSSSPWPNSTSAGVISVFGQIYNDGVLTGSGDVSLHLYDGYDWHNYTEPTGVVPGNGHTDFLWAEIFDPMNKDQVIVEYDLATE